MLLAGTLVRFSHPVNTQRARTTTAEHICRGSRLLEHFWFIVAKCGVQFVIGEIMIEFLTW